MQPTPYAERMAEPVATALSHLEQALAQKQEKKIRMYHSKWEDVKKSAREKEKAKREKAAGEAGGKAVSETAE